MHLYVRLNIFHGLYRAALALRCPERARGRAIARFAAGSEAPLVLITAASVIRTDFLDTRANRCDNDDIPRVTYENTQAPGETAPSTETLSADWKSANV